MRPTLLLSALLAIGTATPSVAQLAKKAAPFTKEAVMARKDKKARIHDAILNQLAGSGAVTANKTTSTTTDERLLAQSTYTYADTTGTGTAVWIINDSVNYFYTGEHGSRFNFNNLNYLTAYNEYATQPMGVGQVFGLFDKDNKPEVLFDSSITYAAFSSYDIEPLLSTYMVYDANNNVTDYKENYVPFGVAFRNLNTFTADGVSAILYMQDFGSGYDTTENRQLAYTSGLITSDSTAYNMGSGTWDPEYKFQYTYDGSGKATRISLFTYDATIPGLWYESTRYDIQYDGSGKFSKMSIRGTSDPTVPLAPQEVDTVGWTSGINYFTYLETRYFSADSVVNDQYIRTYHLNAANLPDSVITKEIDPTVNDTLADQLNTFVYDTYKNPVTSSFYTRSTPTSPTYDTLNSVTHYYYQLYTRDNTGVNDVAKQSSFRLYPNPATNDLFIAQDKLTAAAANVATIKLYDLTGRLVSNTIATGTASKIAMDGLPQGTYLVILQDGNGNMLHQSKVVKL